MLCYVGQIHSLTPFKIFSSKAEFKKASDCFNYFSKGTKGTEAEMKSLIGIDAECFVTAVCVEGGQVTYNVFRGGHPPKQCRTVEQISSQFSIDAATPPGDAAVDPVYQTLDGCESLQRLVEDQDLAVQPLKLYYKLRDATPRITKNLKDPKTEERIVSMAKRWGGLETAMDDEK